MSHQLNALREEGESALICVGLTGFQGSSRRLGAQGPRNESRGPASCSLNNFNVVAEPPASSVR